MYVKVALYSLERERKNFHTQKTEKVHVILHKIQKRLVKAPQCLLWALKVFFFHSGNSQKVFLKLISHYISKCEKLVYCEENIKTIKTNTSFTKFKFTYIGKSKCYHKKYKSASKIRPVYSQHWPLSHGTKVRVSH